jgi:hypothetical protein
MSTFIRTSLVVATILGAAGITGLVLAQSQGDSASGTPAISPELAAQLKAVEQLPTIPADAVSLVGGSFYSAQFPYWPPFPADFYGVPVWDLGDGWFLLDDLQIDYSQIQPEPDPTATTTTMSVNATPMGGGISPDGSTQNGTPYLIIAPTGTNQLLITLTNTAPPMNYEVWWTPVLASAGYPWTVLAVGATNQTNFTVNVGPYQTGFYQAIWDTNAFPMWEAADPNNPLLGVLTVTIISPAQGQIIQ